MKAYLIPGWGEGLKDRNYQAVLDAYKKADYDPEFLNIAWKRTTIEDWVAEVGRKLSKEDIRESLISGFSFGAVAAFSLAAEYQNPSKLLLFSLSSYYVGDNPKPSWLKEIGKRRTASFGAINFKEYAAQIKCPADIFCGSQEGPQMLNRAAEAHKAIKDSRLFIVDKVSHDVTNPDYIKTIERALRTK